MKKDDEAAAIKAAIKHDEETDFAEDGARFEAGDDGTWEAELDASVKRYMQSGAPKPLREMHLREDDDPDPDPQKKTKMTDYRYLED